jgi:hypothetical protein
LDDLFQSRWPALETITVSQFTGQRYVVSLHDDAACSLMVLPPGIDPGPRM